MFNVEVNVGLAFLAGLASFLAPCVLPLVPAYLGYMSGYAITKPDTGRTNKERLYIVTHAVSFVLGFTIVFVILGTVAGSLGALIRGPLLRYVGGVLIIFFGLALVGLLRVPFLYQEAKLEWRGKREWGFLSSFLIGMVFAAGWTPCVGPALTSILLLSAQDSTAAQGAFLLTAYSAGVGLPFILAALLVDQLSQVLNRIGRYLPIIQKVTGVLLIIVGIIVLTDSFTNVGAWLESQGIGWDLGL
ncbi:MAG: cytochrome c biogenesis CcdA family protein [Anaerolineae bacterium]